MLILKKIRFVLIKSLICFRVNNRTRRDSFWNVANGQRDVWLSVSLFMSQIKVEDGQAVVVSLGPQSIRSCCGLRPEITSTPTGEWGSSLGNFIKAVIKGYFISEECSTDRPTDTPGTGRYAAIPPLTETQTPSVDFYPSNRGSARSIPSPFFPQLCGDVMVEESTSRKLQKQQEASKNGD